jgi:hypothetical protein
MLLYNMKTTKRLVVAPGPYRNAHDILRRLESGKLGGRWAGDVYTCHFCQRSIGITFANFMMCRGNKKERKRPAAGGWRTCYCCTLTLYSVCVCTCFLSSLFLCRLCYETFIAACYICTYICMYAFISRCLHVVPIISTCHIITDRIVRNFLTVRP